VTITFSLYDSDEAAVKAIRNAGITKTAIDIILNVGTIVGSVFVLYLKNVQLATPELDDSQRKYVINIGESRAFGTSLTTKDELTMWIA
jgi:hypothetical protein